MPAIPLEPQSFYGRTDEVLTQLVEVHVLTAAGVKYHSGLRVPHGETIRVQNFRQLPNDGHRLGAGPCLRSIHNAFPDRPIDGERVAGEIRPFKPTEFSFAESRERRRSDSCFRQQRQNVHTRTYLGQIVCKRFACFTCISGYAGVLDRVHTIKRAFVLCMSENSAEHTLDMLKRCLAQVVLVGDGLEHPAGIYRPELTQTNLSDAVRYVIVPDFPISFFCRSTQLIRVGQINVLYKFLELHAALRRELAGVESVHEFHFEGHDVGDAWIAFQTS